MAKDIKFNIKLTVDGKEQLVTATTSVNELRSATEAAKGAAGKLRNRLEDFNRAGFAFVNLNSVLGQIAGTLNDLTADSRSYSAAMNAANTMAGKGGEDFAKLKDSVSELSKTLPVARDELANGLYQVISNGVPEDNWISFLEQSAKASVGGIADLGETVKVTSTVIKNYGLSWDKAEYIQDKIQLTAKNGVTMLSVLVAIPHLPFLRCIEIMYVVRLIVYPHQVSHRGKVFNTFQRAQIKSVNVIAGRLIRTHLQMFVHNLVRRQHTNLFWCVHRL